MSTPTLAGNRWFDATLLIAGLGALVAGAIGFDWAAQFRDTSIREFGSMVAVVLGSAWILSWRRRFGFEAAAITVAVIGAAILLGLPAVLATALLALVALAVGSLVVPASLPGRLTLSLVAGLGLVAATIGWLLPYSIHSGPAHALLALLVIVLRRRALLAMLEPLRHFRLPRSGAPVRLAALLAIAYAASSAILPTTQPDDLAYHLGLPWQLAEFGHYRFDVAGQVWAVAPWTADVLHGIVQLLAGGEARGALNLLWLLLALRLMWLLLAGLGVGESWRWLGVALVACQPMTHSLVQSMQTELPAMAVVLALALLVVEAARGDPERTVRPIAVIAGLALALKVSTIALLGPLALWFLVVARPLPWAAMLRSVPWVLLVGGSSYLYAWVLTGNPVLPLFNHFFESPFFAPHSFEDIQFRGLLEWNVPWLLVADASRFNQGLDGAPGVHWLLLAGPLFVMALTHRDLRPWLAVGLATTVPLFIEMQYLRYIYPGMALLLVPMVVAAARSSFAPWRWAAWIAILGNLALIGHGIWTVRDGTLSWVGRHGSEFGEAYLTAFAPERLANRFLREQGPGVRALYVLPDAAPIADLPGRAFAPIWYDPETAQHFFLADEHTDGSAWRAGIERRGITHVVTQRSKRSIALDAALRAAATLVWAHAELEIHEINEPLMQPHIGNANSDQSPSLTTRELRWPAVANGPYVMDARVRIRCHPAGAALVISVGQSRGVEVFEQRSDFPRCPRSEFIDWKLTPFAIWIHDAEPTMVVRPFDGPGIEAAGVAVESATMRLRPDVAAQRDFSDRLRP
jgi:hypothetical protein